MNVIAVDVGSGSVRVALISFADQSGSTDITKVLASESKATTTHSPNPDWYEQSTSEIWSAVVYCIKECLKKSGTHNVDGIAFTATCSLVVVGEKDSKLTSNLYEGGNDVIMWMDHRSVKEAAKISASGDQLLNQVGGICSPEFSLAKLSWLKENSKEKFDSSIAFMELPDYLTWKCLVSSGLSDQDNVKLFQPSSCSVVCKWFYDAANDEWSRRLMERVEVDSLLDGNCTKIGSKQYSLLKIFNNLIYQTESPVLPGTFLGYMSEEVKKQMDINSESRVSVASSIIDAHAGVLAMLAIHCNSAQSPVTVKDIEGIFCSITGTSSCHMISSKHREELPGIWGPYYNVILKDFYVHEPGQSATGKLLDHIVNSYKCLDGTLYSGKSTEDVYRSLSNQIAVRHSNLLKNPLLVNPDFHGNRSPLADPSMTGGIHGLSLNKQLTLLELYEAAIESLIYETRFIQDRMKKKPKVILVSGGLTKNPAFMQIYADVMGTTVTGMDLPNIDMMLTGSSLLARQAVLKNDGPILNQMTGITLEGLNLTNYVPNERYQNYHEKKYEGFLELMACSQKLSKNLQNL